MLIRLASVFLFLQLLLILQGAPRQDAMIFILLIGHELL